MGGSQCYDFTYSCPLFINPSILNTHTHTYLQNAQQRRLDYRCRRMVGRYRKSPPSPPTLRNLMPSSPLSSCQTLEHPMFTSSWPILSSLKHQRELNMSLPEKPIYAIPKRLMLSSTLNLELQTPSIVSTVSCPEDLKTTLISV